MAVSSIFVPGTGVLTTTGDSLDNTITTSRDAAGNILVNGGAVVIQGGAPTVGNTGAMQVFGLEGSDTITLNETNGALPAALVFGGNGNDVVTGGSGADQIFGEAGNDTLLGKGGTDILNGGDGNDTLTGGDGDDQMFGGAGNDRIIWNPGDDSDLAEGGDGTDTLEVNGGNGAETFTITPNGTRFRVDRVNPAPFNIDAGTIENVVINANGGDDIISGANGLSALTSLTIDGGTGNDTITGGDGADLLLGGDGNDTLTGGRGNDVIFAGAGDDRVIWNPADGSDTVEGQDGVDTLEINGSSNGEVFTVAANGARVRVDGTTFTLDVGGVENIVINANGGDDVIVAGNGLAALTSLVVDGGAGNDVIVGGDGADTFLGGDGNDTVVGGRGDDVALLGAGDDVFRWNPGDGNDIVEGQDGADRLDFNGANIAENIDISANGGRVRFTRDVANVTMDLNDVERIDFHALGGADNIVINDVTGTDLPLAGVAVDLEGVLGSGVADGQLDRVTLAGTAGNDTINVASISGGTLITGTPAAVAILHSDAADQLIINGGTGNDTINASALAAGAIALTFNGGLGNDTFIGSQGNDLVVGGDGDDLALLGAGNDVFVWNPGDDNDTVEGQAGIDRLDFNGANIAENIDISANGERVRFFRDIANVTMDLNDVEQIDFHALGGADNITVNDLTGTDLVFAGVKIDLEGALGSGIADGQLDRVTVNGGAGSEAINVTPFNGGVLVSGTPAGVGIFHADATDQLVVNGNAGNDTINASTLAAGAIALTLNGGLGNDTLIGSQGNDLLHGGDGNDTLTGGVGDDQMFGEAGDDRMIWNPGDGTDLAEGGDGIDTVEVNGGNGAEVFTATANGTRVRLDRVNPAPFSIDIGTTEKLVLNMNGGDDTFSATGNLAALIGVTVDGGAGNDTILGSNGADLLLGGDGNDFIDGNQGNDTALLGAGDDVFQWDPGDGSDTVEGQAGIDRLDFNGSNIAENIDISANGGRVRFTRDVANIVMDLNDVEQVDFHALGGADNITVNDLTGTDLPLAGVKIELESALGSGVADGQLDRVTVNGGAGSEAINVTPFNGGVLVSGTPAGVGIFHADATDQLVVNGNAGNDTINASTLAAGAITLTLDGGLGNDTLIGSQGADTFLGGDGNDTVVGGRGDDVALLGAGDDVFRWNPGDGNDIVEGQDGADRLDFNGANIAENIDISANGGRVRFTRDVANVTMDLNDVERIDFHALGGADNIVINDVTGTDLPLAGVAVDLEGVLGSGVADGQLDRVTLAGTAGNDTINVASISGGTLITGTPAAVAILHSDAADQLIINGGTGNDTINASALAAGAIALTFNGGLGNDTFIGSQGNDLVVGGDGDDLALLGAGNDVFVWNPGDDNDTVEGQAGIDRLDFNGANIAENIDISANGERVRFFRDIANVTMDLNDVEQIDFHALGGADNITVNDLTGTDLVFAGVKIDLEGALGSGIADGQLDRVTVNGGAGSEAINVTPFNGGVLVSGTPAGVGIFHADATDQLVVNGNAGNDTINASTLAAGAITLTLDGGLGNDTLIGSQGADTFLGGDGNDTVVGGRGDDVALLGAGDDVFRWNSGDGNDIVEGQDGADRLDFNGANIAENIDISANGGRVRFTRDVANVTMDLNDVERIDFHALGGADNIVINDVTGTDLPLAGVAVDLEGVLGSGVADGQLDRVTLAGTAGNDTINVASISGGTLITGTPAAVAILHSDAADQLIINGGTGNDTINASALAAGAIALTFNGGLGNDTFIGSQGNDLVVGGDGDDLALLGAGNDVFVWNPGDDNDTVEGQAGIDRLDFNGANIAENIDISANGERVRFFRDIANVTMDLNDVEQIDFHALGGADNITVNDLTGTDLVFAGVKIDLEGALGSGIADGQLDRVTVNGGAGSEAINVTPFNGGVLVSGTPAGVGIFHADATDQLVVNGNAGNDTINASTLAAGAIALTLNGGAGNDTLIGSQGNDTIFGGIGNDVAFMGSGDDVFVWNPGDGSDTVEGQAGVDQLVFNGANINENIDISANGGRVRFTRDVANITMDTNDVERIDFHALGGADNITVNDMSGTDVSKVQIDLAAAGGGGDGQVDTIFINATNGADAIFISNVNGVVTISGLAAEMTISGFEATDRIVINGLAGDDVIDASGLGTAMSFTANGGDGDDVLIGSDGNDTLSGGAGDDVLIGGAGVDALDGGPGDNVVIQSIVAGIPGNGAVNFAGVTDVIDIPADTDFQTITGGTGDDVIDASALYLGTTGFAVVGGEGNDTLVGSQGKDILIGGAGNDLLAGGAGVDHLFGGAGQDAFVFAGTSLATLDTGVGANRDVIGDFAPGDVIQLANIDANLNVGGDQAFSFVGTDAFSAAGQVRFFADGAGNTIVEGNLDNNPGADFQIELHNFTGQLHASDFLL